MSAESCSGRGVNEDGPTPSPDPRPGYPHSALAAHPSPSPQPSKHTLSHDDRQIDLSCGSIRAKKKVEMEKEEERVWRRLDGATSHHMYRTQPVRTLLLLRSWVDWVWCDMKKGLGWSTNELLSLDRWHTRINGAELVTVRGKLEGCSTWGSGV